jgi:hypothetical protein
VALPTNIRLGWKGLQGTNTLAYCENLSITAVKSFIVQAPDLLVGHAGGLSNDVNFGHIDGVEHLAWFDNIE